MSLSLADQQYLLDIRKDGGTSTLSIYPSNSGLEPSGSKEDEPQSEQKKQVNIQVMFPVMEWPDSLKRKTSSASFIVRKADSMWGMTVIVMSSG